MTTFAERADQLSDQLRELEHQAEDNDQLFFCAYLLGLLGLHSAVEGEGADDFDAHFSDALTATMADENMTEADQAAILALWQQVV
jgi:hypothetical protein